MSKVSRSQGRDSKGVEVLLICQHLLHGEGKWVVLVSRVVARRVAVSTGRLVSRVCLVSQGHLVNRVVVKQGTVSRTIRWVVINKVMVSQAMISRDKLLNTVLLTDKDSLANRDWQVNRVATRDRLVRRARLVSRLRLVDIGRRYCRDRLTSRSRPRSIGAEGCRNEVGRSCVPTEDLEIQGYIVAYNGRDWDLKQRRLFDTRRVIGHANMYRSKAGISWDRKLVSTHNWAKPQLACCGTASR